MRGGGRKMRTRKGILAGGAIVLALAGAAWLLTAALSSPEVAAETAADEQLPASRRGQDSHAKRVAARTKKARRVTGDTRGAPSAGRKAPPRVEAEGEDLSPQDRACSDAIQAALDDEDYPRLLPWIAEAAKSANAEVRSEAVEALRWFGKKAMAELTMFMADDDDDVRTSACDAWTTALSEVESASEKGALLAAAMDILTDGDQLESMVMEMNDLPNAQQIAILTQLIEGKNKTAAAVAREHYEFVTGDPYVSRDAAQKWLLENPDDEP